MIETLDSLMNTNLHILLKKLYRLSKYEGGRPSRFGTKRDSQHRNRYPWPQRLCLKMPHLWPENDQMYGYKTYFDYKEYR